MKLLVRFKQALCMSTQDTPNPPPKKKKQPNNTRKQKEVAQEVVDA